MLGDEPRALGRNDARPEQMPHVRGQRVDLALVAVEPDDVETAALVRPERVVEPVVELGRLDSTRSARPAAVRGAGRASPTRRFAS